MELIKLLYGSRFGYPIAESVACLASDLLDTSARQV